jgi:Zn-finger nucleic acid-binding protein
VYEATLRNPHGYMMSQDADGNITESDTRSCPHCSAHFTMVKGSGVKRGWCPRCDAVCCGREECMICIPIEAKLDFVEGTKTAYDDKIRDAVATHGPGILL